MAKRFSGDVVVELAFTGTFDEHGKPKYKGIVYLGSDESKRWGFHELCVLPIGGPTSEESYDTAAENALAFATADAESAGCEPEDSDYDSYPSAELAEAFGDAAVCSLQGEEKEREALAERHGFDGGSYVVFRTPEALDAFYAAKRFGRVWCDRTSGAARAARGGGPRNSCGARFRGPVTFA
jgi:hypothetical protein